MVKENPKKGEPEQKSDNQNTLLNVLVIVLIIGVFYSTKCMRDQIKELESSIQNAKVTLNSEPIQANVNIVSNKKNPNCPKSEDDYNSCLDKVVRCKETEKQFADAQQQFQKLISDCAISNEKNEKINADLQKEIRELEENVRKIQGN